MTRNMRAQWVSAQQRSIAGNRKNIKKIANMLYNKEENKNGRSTTSKTTIHNENTRGDV